MFVYKQFGLAMCYILNNIRKAMASFESRFKISENVFYENAFRTNLVKMQMNHEKTF